MEMESMREGKQKVGAAGVHGGGKGLLLHLQAE